VHDAPGARERGPRTLIKIAILIVGGLATLGVLFAHPIGPALVILAISPYEGIVFNLLGWAGNFLTPLWALAMLIRTPNSQWAQVFFGSRIQALAAFFVVVLVIPHLMSAGLFGFNVMLKYGVKVMVYVLMCVVVWSVRDPRNWETATRVIVVSIAVMTFFGLIDFFLGTSILPGAVEPSQFAGEGAAGQVYDPHLKGALRFEPSGGAYNRFAMWLILPIFLSLGWAMSPVSTLTRVIALGCFSVMTMGVIASISRAAYLGFGLGMLVLLPTALRINRRQVFGITAVGAFGLLAAVLIVSQTATWDAVLARFSSADVGNSSSRRLGLAMTGVRAFMDSPIIGVGVDQLPLATAKYTTDKVGLGSHNSFVNVLVETGLLGFIPWISLLIMTLRQLSRRAVASAGRWEYWRPFVRCALIALLVPLYFNDFAYERNLWWCIGVAAVLERYETAEARQRLRARYASMHPGAEEAMGVASATSDGVPARQL